MFYDLMAAQRHDSPELQEKIRETVAHLMEEATSVDRPGMLLGRIQSGKTRAFLGVIAAAFDAGFGGAIVLTKGTKSLALQTLRRVEVDFGSFRERDDVQIFDIMQMPPELSAYELAQKLIIVAKKEDDNLYRLIDLYESHYPSLKERRWLIIDDEADFASITFRKRDGAIEPGIINQQIEDLRQKLHSAQFLEVTATPYSLYLQPEQGVWINGIPILKPRKPRFTVMLPLHPAYVGGEYYFEESANEDSPASFLYEEVSMEERDTLKRPDGRRLKLDDVLISPRIRVLRRAIMNFIVGACMRRLQQAQAGAQQHKYAFVVHTEQGRDAHEWQLDIVRALRDALQDAGATGAEQIKSLIAESYADLAPSVKLAGQPVPTADDVEDAVSLAIRDGWLMAEKVNSDNEIEALLDKQSGQLRLRTPLNLFIGGQILDRGVTIHNLIGFYYGRSPQRAQQDTTLQHARMYGARDPLDLGVTRFYAPLVVYNRMRQIHELDASLRNAFLNGVEDHGIFFVQTDERGQIIPCAPNKLLSSDVYAMRPGKRLLPVAFNTVAPNRGQGRLAKLDEMVHRLAVKGDMNAVLIPVDVAKDMVRLAYDNLVFEEEEEQESSLKSLLAALDWLSKTTTNESQRGQVWLLTAEGRSVRRVREEGRFTNAPDTKQQRDVAEHLADKLPVLTMLRQNGEEQSGWRGLAFWWPVVMTPTSAVTSLYSVN